MPDPAGPHGPDRPAVVQFWDREPPSEVGTLIDGWRAAAAAAGFDHILFDDASARDFIARHHGKAVERAFLASALPAMRADVLRYCALAVRPGVYVDADVECVRFRPAMLGAEPRGRLFFRGGRVVNDVMMVKQAGDPLLAALIDRAVHNIAARASNNVWSVTGPGIATALLQTHGAAHPLFAGFRMDDAAVLGAVMRFRNDLAYRAGDGHWSRAQQSRSIFADGPA